MFLHKMNVEIYINENDIGTLVLNRRKKSAPLDTIKDFKLYPKTQVIRQGLVSDVRPYTGVF